MQYSLYLSVLHIWWTKASDELTNVAFDGGWRKADTPDESVNTAIAYFLLPVSSPSTDKKNTNAIYKITRMVS